VASISEMVEEKVKNLGGRPKKPDSELKGKRDNRYVKVAERRAATNEDLAALNETFSGISDVGHAILAARFPQYHPRTVQEMEDLRMGRRRSFLRVAAKYLGSFAAYGIEIDFAVQWLGPFVVLLIPKEFQKPMDASGLFPPEAHAAAGIGEHRVVETPSDYKPTTFGFQGTEKNPLLDRNGNPITNGSPTPEPSKVEAKAEVDVTEPPKEEK
jgi:hypothetical protein